MNDNISMAEFIVQHSNEPALMRGYLDKMLGLPKPTWITPELEARYEEGIAKCSVFRSILESKDIDWDDYCTGFLLMNMEIHKK